MEIEKVIEKEDKIYEKNRDILDIKTSENKKIKSILKDVISNRSINIVFCTSCGGLLKQTNKSVSNCFIDSKCTKASYYYCYSCLINYCTYCVRDVRAGKCSKGHLLFKISNLYNDTCKNCNTSIQNEGYNCNLCNISICSSCYKIFNSFSDPTCDKCKLNLRWGKYYFNACSNCANFTVCNWSCFFCKFYYCTKCLQPNKNYCGGFHYLELYSLSNENSTDLNKLNQNVKNIEGENAEININPLGLICAKCEGVFSYSYKCCKRCNYQLCSECD